MLTRLTGVKFPGVIIFTLTGQTGDLLFRALLDLLGKLLGKLVFLAKDTDLEHLVGCLGVLEYNCGPYEGVYGGGALVLTRSKAWLDYKFPVCGLNAKRMVSNAWLVSVTSGKFSFHLESLTFIIIVIFTPANKATCALCCVKVKLVMSWYT